MASDFPAYACQRIEEHSRVLEFTPGTTTNAFVPGSIVYYDTATNLAKLCGADPSLIAGISEHDSVKGALLTPNGKVPVRVLGPSCVVAMCSATTYAEASHRGNVYGIAKLSSGNWAVDFSDTSNTRVIVIDGDPDKNIWYVQFTAANLQFDAIAS